MKMLPLLALLHATSALSAQTYVFTTVAGVAHQSGSADGTGSAARFSHPKGLAVDVAGNIYVTDAGFSETDPGNNTVRKITPGGVVTTLAGLAGSRGTANGTGNSARFDLPSGIAVDDMGNLYVVDTNNGLIRKITAAGVVTTFAGDADQGPFNYPADITIDRTGTLYVTDPYSYSGWKIAPNGAASELPDNFFTPVGIAVDSAGNIYVGHFLNQTITKLTPAGAITLFAGGGTSTDGIGSAAKFGGISALAIDRADNLLVADAGNHTIRRITPSGLVTTIAGSTGAGGNVDGRGSAVRFDALSAIAVDSAGNLYVADGDTIRKGVPVTDGTGGPVTPAVPSRIANLSVRSVAGLGSDALIIGFSVAGSGTKPVLLRAVGPTLVQFGIGGMLGNPTLRLDVLNGRLVAQNDDWATSRTAGEAANIVSTSARVGAFPLDAASRDSVLLEALSTGAYTAQVGGGAGLALVEIYDAGTDTATKLVNVSARTRSGPGPDILIVGLFLEGEPMKTLLIRGIGPTLTQFGVTGALADSRLQLFSGTRLVAENDDWGASTGAGGSTALAAAFASVGAFALPPNSKDAALLVTLPSGGYTAQVGGVGDATGVALVEIYEIQ